MSEHKSLIDKPKKALTEALHSVKGENTSKLIEEFTAEMTLVAEGLCEDQQQLHRQLESRDTRFDERFQGLDSHIEMLEKQLDDERHEHDKSLTELRNRLAFLEKQNTANSKNEKKRKTSIIKDLTVLVSIIAVAWITVTLISKLL